LADNEKDEPLGRAFIAAILLRCEREVSLSGDWYRNIFNHLINENEHSPEILSVLTFNYDRSFERYLYLSYRGLRQNDDGAARQFLNRIRIVHVYGSLGPLFVTRSPNDPIIPFGEYQQMKQADYYFHLVRAQESRDITRIKTFIDDAKRIVFLGFGFDPMNLDAIGMGSDPNKPVFASCYRLEKRLMNNAVDKIGRGILWGDRGHTVAEFLHNEQALC